MENNYYPFENTPLPYAYEALEPFIDEKTMRLHHDRHLQTYINNLNKALEDFPSLQRFSLEQLLKCPMLIPPNKKDAILNNGGGVYNHRFFFENMTPQSQNYPYENLNKAIIHQFKSFDCFKNEFKRTALSVFGSGYAWLVFYNGRLKIVKTSNQNTPITMGFIPLICIDVWEHAYYLKHYNMRNDYIDDWFNVINWNNAENIYNKILKR